MKKITKINFRDVQALNGLRLCGFALRSDMEKIITANRIDTMLKQGYLESKTDIQGQTVLTYTDKGKLFIQCHDSLHGKTFYPKHPNGTAHDTALYRQYVTLSPQERMSAMSETETRNYYHQTLEHTHEYTRDQSEELRHSIPDLVYQSDSGDTVAIEIVTSNYSQEKIELKESTAAAIGASIQIIRV